VYISQSVVEDRESFRDLLRKLSCDKIFRLTEKCTVALPYKHHFTWAPFTNFMLQALRKCNTQDLCAFMLPSWNRREKWSSGLFRSEEC